MSQEICGMDTTSNPHRFDSGPGPLARDWPRRGGPRPALRGPPAAAGGRRSLQAHGAAGPLQSRHTPGLDARIPHGCSIERLRACRRVPGPAAASARRAGQGTRAGSALEGGARADDLDRHREPVGQQRWHPERRPARMAGSHRRHPDQGRYRLASHAAGAACRGSDAHLEGFRCDGRVGARAARGVRAAMAGGMAAVRLLRVWRCSSPSRRSSRSSSRAPRPD
jgi:hypothetical protein